MFNKLIGLDVFLNNEISITIMYLQVQGVYKIDNIIIFIYLDGEYHKIL